MTDLHWALLAIAGVLLLALWVHSRWQERRALAKLDSALREGVGDPLVAARPAATPQPARRIEPRLDGATLPTPVAAAAALARGGNGVETMVAQSDSPSEEAASDVVDIPLDTVLAEAPAASKNDEAGGERDDASAYALPDGWIEDPLLDFVLELRCAHAVDGVAALEARNQIERLQLPLPVHVAVWDARVQQWTAPDRFGFYTEMLAAVQMAHRNGVLGDIDAARFVAAVQQVAVELDADLDVPDVPRLVAQAAELDALAARFDVQVTLTLLPDEPTAAPWSADVIQAAAAPLGFAAAGNGRWELRDEGGGLALVLSAAPLPAERLVVTIDVPLVPPEASPLGRQFSVADQLAAQLAARVVDDNGNAVHKAAHFSIAAQLAGLYEQMQAAGVPAGGARAVRLYGG